MSFCDISMRALYLPLILQHMSMFASHINSTYQCIFRKHSQGLIIGEGEEKKGFKRNILPDIISINAMEKEDFHCSLVKQEKYEIQLQPADKEK